jgi:hypothetical protein
VSKNISSIMTLKPNKAPIIMGAFGLGGIAMWGWSMLSMMWERQLLNSQKMSSGSPLKEILILKVDLLHEFVNFWMFLLLLVGVSWVVGGLLQYFDARKWRLISLFFVSLAFIWLIGYSLDFYYFQKYTYGPAENALMTPHFGSTLQIVEKFETVIHVFSFLIASAIPIAVGTMIVRGDD